MFAVRILFITIIIWSTKYLRLLAELKRKIPNGLVSAFPNSHPRYLSFSPYIGHTVGSSLCLIIFPPRKNSTDRRSSKHIRLVLKKLDEMMNLD